MSSIPRTQKAAVVPKPGANIEIRSDHPVKQPKELLPGECLVKMSHTGVCHTDLHIKKDDWPISGITPLIGGHEGVGEIVAIGEHTQNSPVELGDRVGIKWLAYACSNCENCRKGLEQLCAKAKNSGFTVDGTFSEYVVSWVDYVSPIPKDLKSADAASILCAGVTTYRAIKYSNTEAGDWIVIPGAGGGLGHLAIQYANVRGLRVIAVDTGADKKQLCLGFGAEKWIDFKETKDLTKSVLEMTDGLGAHAAVIAASTGESYAKAVDYLRPGGTLMVVGLPGSAKLEASIFFTVLKGISILGSYVGNRQDAIEALDIAARGKVRVEFHLKPLEALKDVYKGLEEGKIAGRIVLEMNK